MKKALLLLLAIALIVIQKSHAQSPVAYYPFTGNANDAVGTNHGTVNGATLTADRFGNANSAYSFDGVDDNISINNDPVFSFSNYTISLWFKYNGPGTAGKSIWSLISKNSNGNGFDDAFHLWVNASTKTTGGRVGNGSSEFYVGNPPPIDNGQWHHSALVFDNANDLVRLYLDGVFISASPNTSNPFINGGQIKIGYWEAFDNYFNGAIDEVKIFNTALTPAQVKQEFSLADYSGQFGNTVQMDGVNDYILVNNSSFNHQEFTIEMWVKPGTTQGQYANIIDNNHTGFQNWVVQQDGANLNYYIFGVHRNSGGTGIYFQLQANQWQHLAFVKSAALMEVYVNGVLVQSAAWTGTVNYSYQSLRMGSWGGGGRNWNGFMDEVRYWTTPRSQAQIIANMNQQLTGNEADLAAYWDMNRDGQGAGLTVDNKCVATGSALNGITVGTASTPVFIPAVAQQKPGSGNAISFDGVDDHIQIPHSSAIDFSLNDNFSIDFWIKMPSGNLPNTDGPDNMIIEKWNEGGPGGYPFTIRTYNQTSGDFGKIRFGRFNGSTGNSILSTITINDDKYHHLSCVKSGTNLLLYIDGVLNVSGSDITTGSTNNSYPLSIARRGGAGYNFWGIVDEFRIWNTDLNQSQIRDRMCRKITSSDALYTNLAAYYNFDEGTGYTVFDGIANANNGTLTNNPTRITSGAAIGNASEHDYVNSTKTASLAHPSGESFTVISSSGNPDGIHVYRVDEKPNTLNGAQGTGANNKYFGVFQTGGAAPQYTAVYNYAGNPAVSNESVLRLYKRNDNSSSTWSALVAIPDEAANTITVTGESTEYILGSIGNPLPLNLISFTGSKQSNDAILQWKTTNEVNVSHFELQRSEDGQNFVTAGTVLPGSFSYQYTDAGIFNSKLVVFYRLKSFDMDNRFSYSAIIKLEGKSELLFTVYPNPVMDMLTIGGLPQKGTIRLFNAAGKLLLQQSVNAQTVTMDISQYAKGMYVLQYQSVNGILSQKIIK